ncbi:MAG: hypothetical protein WDM91_22320 [Rhizomicrobium sp.]
MNGQALSLGANPLAGTSTGFFATETPGLIGSEIAEFSNYTSSISAGVKLLSPAGATLLLGTGAGLYDTYANPGENGASENLNQDFQYLNFNQGQLRNSNGSSGKPLSK